jgi:hypothetical protein
MGGLKAVYKGECEKIACQMSVLVSVMVVLRHTSSTNFRAQMPYQVSRQVS